MIANRLCAFTLATALAAFWSVPPATAATYDGSWNMLAVTTNGHCGVINIGMGITPRPHLFDGRKIRQAPDSVGRPRVRLGASADNGSRRPAHRQGQGTVQPVAGDRDMVRHRSLGSLHRRLERRSRLTRPSHNKTGPVREGDATGPGQEFQVKNRGAGLSPRPNSKITISFPNTCWC